jgi:hypothetical protein
MEVMRSAELSVNFHQTSRRNIREDSTLPFSSLIILSFELRTPWSPPWILFRIWGSHSGGYEEFYLLGYDELHGAISQKIELFMNIVVPAIRLTNPTTLDMDPPHSTVLARRDSH